MKIEFFHNLVGKMIIFPDFIFLVGKMENEIEFIKIGRLVHIDISVLSIAVIVRPFKPCKTHIFLVRLFFAAVVVVLMTSTVQLRARR